MPEYRGRFAPSPTGLLHIGSLYTAVASFLEARQHQGKWLLRMEDLDPPRTVKGAPSHILATLEAFGLTWDESVVYQSKRHHLYRAALNQLKEQGDLYPCYCSRKQIHEEAISEGVDGYVYSGRCRNETHENATTKAPAWRFKVANHNIGFEDAIMGHCQQNLAQEVGDFILLRADGFWAYQLAVVVDDAEQNINHIVRGQDLLVSTPRQIALQAALNYPQPHYTHLPLLTNHLGQKWSKQTLAPALDEQNKENLMRTVLAYLHLPTPPDQYMSVNELLTWAIPQWSLSRLSQEDINTENLV